MEEQNELKIGIGNIEPERETLKPAEVKIVDVRIEDTPKAKKVVFEVNYPDKEGTIKISSVAHIVDKQVRVVGTWLNLDKEGNLQKGSGLVVLLKKILANNIEEAKFKKVDTELNGNYLCFKAY
jgi:hypothetical protein